MPEIHAKLALNGAFVRHLAPAEITAFVQNEQKTWQQDDEYINTASIHGCGRTLSGWTAPNGICVPG